MKSCVCPLGSLRTVCASQTFCRRVNGMNRVDRTTRLRDSRLAIRGSGPRRRFENCLVNGWPTELTSLRPDDAKTASSAPRGEAERHIPMAEIQSFRDLDAWKASMKLALEAYEVAKLLPATERFELSAQIRRAAISVPSNVAEGQANGPGRRYRYHVRIALGSWAELVTHLELVEITEPPDASEVVRL